MKNSAITVIGGILCSAIMTACGPNGNEYVETKRGDGLAQYYKGVYYGNIKNHERAAGWYRKSAEQGYAPAQYMLGVCYDNGRGVTKDSVEAVNRYRMAAEQGYMKAQINLGFCYENGSGVTKNPEEAADWYRRAAEQGYAPAQYNMGICYANGRGVTKDPAEAINWYRMAAEQGHSTAQYNLAFCYKNGNGIKKDENIALYWYEKAFINTDGRLAERFKTFAGNSIRELTAAGYSSSRAVIAPVKATTKCADGKLCLSRLLADRKPETLKDRIVDPYKGKSEKQPEVRGVDDKISLVSGLPYTVEYAIDGVHVSIGIVYDVHHRYYSHTSRGTSRSHSSEIKNKRWCLFDVDEYRYRVIDRALVDEIAKSAGITLPSDEDILSYSEKSSISFLAIFIYFVIIIVIQLSQVI